ncbi:MAG: ABC transporter substrate-binding protein, partial [Mycetocola sp.]
MTRLRRRRLRLVPTLALLTGAAIVLSGCAAGTGPAAQDASATPVSGGTLDFAIQVAPSDIDPHNGSSSFSEGLVIVNIADKLIYQDPETGELQPWLATEWSSNDDSTVFDITLRDDVTFSDDTPLTPEVVKENFDILANGDADLGVIPVTAFWREYDKTEVTGDNTLRVTFKQPSAGFPQALSHYYSGILGSSTLKLQKEERTKPENIVATGPFTVSEHVYQEKTVLTRRDDYNWAPASAEHQGPAYLEQINFRVVPEPSVRTGALLSGEVDAILDVNLTDEEAISQAGYELLSQVIPGRDIALDLHTDTFPTNELAVREAIKYGWDREALESTVLTDSYDVATSVVSNRVPGYVDHSDDLRYDPELAESILDDAGWVVGDDGIREKDGKRLTVSLLSAPLLVPNKPSFELIQQNLKEIGIELDLNILPPADAWGARETQDWNIEVWNQSRDDSVVIEQSYSPEWNNNAKLSEGDEYWDKAIEVLSPLSSTTDVAKRAEYAAAAQDWILN